MDWNPRAAVASPCSAAERRRELLVPSCRLSSAVSSISVFSVRVAEFQQTVDPALYFCLGHISPANALECAVPLAACSQSEVPQPEIRENEPGCGHPVDIPAKKELFQGPERRLAGLDDIQNGFVRPQEVRKDVVQACQRFLCPLAASIAGFTLDVREKNVFANLYAVCRDEPWHLHGVDWEGQRWALMVLSSI